MLRRIKQYYFLCITNLNVFLQFSSPPHWQGTDEFSDFAVLKSPDSLLQSCYLVMGSYLIFVHLFITVEIWNLGISIIKLFNIWGLLVFFYLSKTLIFFILFTSVSVVFPTFYHLKILSVHVFFMKMLKSSWIKTGFCRTQYKKLGKVGMPDKNNCFTEHSFKNLIQLAISYEWPKRNNT